MMCAVGMHLGERGSMVLWRCVWLDRICSHSLVLFFFFTKTLRNKES